MCLHKPFILFLLLLSAATLPAQDVNTNSLDSFTAKFITALRANATERAYLTTDKSVYKAGEYIWFNALLLNTISQKLSSKSKFLFVDIVDDRDSVIKRLMMDAANRQLYSRIQLPDTLSSGYYWLRAYTKRMTLHDSNYIGIKPLYVAGKTDNYAARSRTNRSDNTDTAIVSFYPEGGTIITGIDGTVALAVSDGNGVPLNTEVVIKDNKDAVVTKCTTNTNGLGKFQFEPSGFRKYKAVVNYKGKEWSYPLPGYDYYKGQIGATRQGNLYQLRILLGDSIYKKDALSYVVGISRDSLVFAAFGKGLYQVNVETNKLPAGITTFYLFDKNFNLLSERAVYIDGLPLQVNILTNKEIYKQRDKVILNVAVTDALQHAVPALISVAVSDSVFAANSQTCNFSDIEKTKLADNLFLATHRCFSDEDKDLMMLTKSGTYETLVTAQHNDLPADDSLLHISGKILNRKNEDAAKIVTLISNTGNDGLFYTDTTDTNGQFRFAIETVPDSTQYGLEVKDLKNHTVNADIITDAMNYPQLKTPAAIKQVFVTTPKPAIDRLVRKYDPEAYGSEGRRLPPVTVKDVKIADYDVSKRVSPSSIIISGKDLDGRTGVNNLILKVPGLQLVNGFLVMQGLFSITGVSAATEPVVMVNGAQVPLAASGGVGNGSPVLSYLSALNPREIDFIEVLKGSEAANYGVRGANGVILINPASKVRTLGTSGSNMKIFYANGVAKPALFPASVYNEKDKKSTLLPDIRSTLFWSGHYITSEDNKAVFTLYTSDVPATYTVTVTGITQRGDFIYKTINFNSK